MNFEDGVALQREQDCEEDVGEQRIHLGLRKVRGLIIRAHKSVLELNWSLKAVSAGIFYAVVKGRETP